MVLTRGVKNVRTTYMYVFFFFLQIHWILIFINFEFLRIPFLSYDGFLLLWILIFINGIGFLENGIFFIAL